MVCPFFKREYLKNNVFHLIGRTHDMGCWSPGRRRSHCDIYHHIMSRVGMHTKLCAYWLNTLNRTFREDADRSSGPFPRDQNYGQSSRRGPSLSPSSAHVRTKPSARRPPHHKNHSAHRTQFPPPPPHPGTHSAGCTHESATPSVSGRLIPLRVFGGEKGVVVWLVDAAAVCVRARAPIVCANMYHKHLIHPDRIDISVRRSADEAAQDTHTK